MDVFSILVEGIKSYVEGFYPSGTKQARGSDLDAIVESARRSALNRIAARLLELQKR
jgi:hypothetical protein